MIGKCRTQPFSITKLNARTISSIGTDNGLTTEKGNFDEGIYRWHHIDEQRVRRRNPSVDVQDFLEFPQ